MKAGYDASGARYLQARREDSEDIRLVTKLLDRLPAGALVLDAGCGAGEPVTRIVGQRFDVIGVDVSRAQLTMAKSTVPLARFSLQDIALLGFRDRCFDAVCSYYAIIHVPRREHRELVSEFARVLKPGGVALLGMGAADSPGDTGDGFHGVPMCWSHFDTRTNVTLFSQCALQVLWSSLVADPDGSAGQHLFVLVQRLRSVG